MLYLSLADVLRHTTKKPMAQALKRYPQGSMHLSDSLRKEIVLAPEWFLMLGEGAAKRAELGELYGRSEAHLHRRRD